MCTLSYLQLEQNDQFRSIKASSPAAIDTLHPQSELIQDDAPTTPSTGGDGYSRWVFQSFANDAKAFKKDWINKNIWGKLWLNYNPNSP